MITAMRCQLCGTEPLVEFVAKTTTFQHCPKCGLYQYGTLAAPREYDGDYHAEYERHRTRKLLSAEVRLNRVEALAPTKRPRLLDVGCSVGFTVEAAVGRGWEATGVDVSEKAVAECARRGLDCRVVPGTELPFDDDSFDALVSWHVIEHVRDVRTTLEEWRRVLRPGGVLAVETPDPTCRMIRWRRRTHRTFWAPEHTYTFTPETMRRFIAEAGFETLRPPFFGRLLGRPPRVAVYVFWLRLLHTVRRFIGTMKAFQAFARKT